MNIENYSQKISDFAKDIRLNLQSVLTPEGAPGLTREQISLVALSCAYSKTDLELAKSIIEEFGVDQTIIDGAKSAASLMAMNNVYYRFLSLCGDEELAKLPARLRMNVIGKPPVPKLDFELSSLAVSTIGGCAKCISAHINEVRKGGLSNEAIHSAVRIASVINAVDVSIKIA
jgi:lipoyl-dependent peroxiredoxin subunit D